MIFHREIIFYLFSTSVVILTLFRLRKFLSYYFDDFLSIFISLLILLHPLSIDSFLAPNLFAGSMAFLLFIEAQLAIKNGQLDLAFLFFGGTAFLNISYGLFPLYFYILHRKAFKKFLPIILFYSFLLLLFFTSHLLPTAHNPFLFLGYFIQNIIAPITPMIISYAIFPFHILPILLSVLLLLIFFLAKKKNNVISDFWPWIFLPIIGVLFSPWTEPINFWHDILYFPSSYLTITFSIIIISALLIPKKLLYLSCIFIFFFSLYWGRSWLTPSTFIASSLSQVPSDFHNDNLKFKRVLAKQFYDEKNYPNSQNVLLLLNNDFPENIEIKQDLEELQKSIQSEGINE